MSTKPIACDFLVEGIEILQNRGYDSAGIALVDSVNKSLEIKKLASNNFKKIDCISSLKQII